MRKMAMALLLSLFMITPASAELTPREAAVLLDKSVVQLSTACSGAKIGSHQFLTARHCIRPGLKITVRDNRHISLTPQSITISFQEKVEGNRKEDWAIIRTTTDYASLKPLMLGCNEELYLGMPVAYAGFPGPSRYFFSTGYITSLQPIKSPGSNHDFSIDAHGGPGASGSAIISLDTGNVIGVLTEGVMSSRSTGTYAIGIEMIRNLDLCDPIPIKTRRAR